MPVDELKRLLMRDFQERQYYITGGRSLMQALDRSGQLLVTNCLAVKPEIVKLADRPDHAQCVC